jgi:hypothetical protein
VTQPPASLDAHHLSGVRARYLAAARTALELLDAPEVRERWDEASVLAGLTVGDLAGHLALSGVLIVEALLDEPDPHSPSPVTAGQYYGAFVGADDPASELNVSVRERSHAVGVRGWSTSWRPRPRPGTTRGPGSRPSPPTARWPRAARRSRSRSTCAGAGVELAVHLEDLELSVGPRGRA